MQKQGIIFSGTGVLQGNPADLYETVKKGMSARATVQFKPEFVVNPAKNS